jgi:hypothetical protein
VRPLDPAAVLIGALGGALADRLGARLAGQRSSRVSMLAMVLWGAGMLLLLSRHPVRGWHGVLRPLWLWGWLAAADADLRVQELYDAHTGALLGLALLAAVGDRQWMVGMAGAAIAAGLWGVVRWGMPWWTWRLSAGMAVLGLAVAAVSLLGRDPGGPARAVIGLGAALASPLLGWIGSASRRARRPEDRVGGADLILWAAVGAWFGARWMWPVLAAAVVALGAAGAIQMAVARRGIVPPWGRDGLPVVPVIALVLTVAS